jgi:hypothetical protein
MSVGIATGYELYDRNSIPGRGRDVSLFCSVQTGSVAQPPTYSADTFDYFPGSKAGLGVRPDVI